METFEVELSSKATKMSALWDNMDVIDEHGAQICVCRPHELECCARCTCDNRYMNKDARRERDNEKKRTCWDYSVHQPCDEDLPKV
jgi:hypothetical protein